MENGLVPSWAGKRSGTVIMENGLVPHVLYYYVRLVTDEKKLAKLTSKPTFVSRKTFNENLMCVHKVKETVTLN